MFPRFHDDDRGDKQHEQCQRYENHLRFAFFRFRFDSPLTCILG